MKRWHGTLIIFAVMVVALAFNTALARWLPYIENVILILHIAGFFIVLITITVMAPVKSSAHDVFAQFTNGGGFESTRLSLFVGLLGAVFMFLGADGAVHMAEEMKGATTALPLALVSSIVINGTLGFAMLIAVLFCIGDLDAALESPTGYPFIAIFTSATQSVAGGTGLTAVVLTFSFYATIAVLTAASRQLWAFSRDNGLPFSKFASYVDPKLRLPTPAIGITVIVTCLLSLINIGSVTAFNAMISLVVAGYLASYILPLTLMIWRRLTDPTLELGPWNMGKTGNWVNMFAVVWAIIAFFFSFWPPLMNPDLATMKYVLFSVIYSAMSWCALSLLTPVYSWSILLYGFTVIFSIVFYLFYGRKTYKGLVIETSGSEIIA